MTKFYKHDELLDILKKEHKYVKTRGFREALSELLDIITDKTEDGSYISLLPDAYHIDTVEHIVKIYEVVVTNDISAHIEKYLILWDLLDYYECDLKLYRIDEYGMVEVDLCDLYYRQMQKDIVGNTEKHTATESIFTQKT